MGSQYATIKDSIDEKNEIDETNGYFQPTQIGLHIEIGLEQKPLKVGYLLKRGFKNFASWKRRYCVLLSDGYFNYYNSKRKIKGSVNFSRSHQCISCSKDNKKFFVLTNKRTWEFKSESKNDTNEWIKLIQNVMVIKNTNDNKKEFDSDDDDNEYKQNKKNKNRRRRRTSSNISLSASLNTSLTDKNDNYITFESWKISIINSLKDVITTIENRKKKDKNYNPINYNDNYNEIYNICKDDKKMKKIFNKITNNNRHMSIKQYILSMSLIQKSRTEIELIAKQILNHNQTTDYTILNNNITYTDNNNNNNDDTQSIISTLSTLSNWKGDQDDTQSIISELSTNYNNYNYRRRISNKSYNSYNSYNNRPSRTRMHSFKVSYTGFDGGQFNILDENKNENENENEEFYDEFSELQFDYNNDNSERNNSEVNNYDYNHNIINNNIRVEIAVNPACEILGNFLGASCGLCVPSLDVITSSTSAETYKLLSEYTEYKQYSLYESPPTLLVYEELNGVSLSDLKKQLEIVSINIKYKSDKDTTTQERIQKYFVSVVRKTFGYPFHTDGRSMIRDAGFIFAIDMFLFNISRFPVLLPFEGKTNSSKLFISTDEDGDSALYGLSNRFLGGHNQTEIPKYLLDKQTKQKQNTTQHLNKYLNKLQSFLSVLSDYYEKKISQSNINTNTNTNTNSLLHGAPETNISNNTNNNQYEKINYQSIINKCLRPIANYLYIHCGFELIIIDEYNIKNIDNSNNDEKNILKILEIYRNKLIDQMITLICEGILIGIQEISQQLEIKDIDIIIQDIKTLDSKMQGIDLIDANFLKMVLRLFHSTAISFQLNIEESSSEESADDKYKPITPTPTMQNTQPDFD